MYNLAFVGIVAMTIVASTARPQISWSFGRVCRSTSPRR